MTDRVQKDSMMSTKIIMYAFIVASARAYPIGYRGVPLRAGDDQPMKTSAVTVAEALFDAPDGGKALSIEQKIGAIEETEATSANMFLLMRDVQRYMATLEDAHAVFVESREALLFCFWKPGERPTAGHSPLRLAL